MNPTDTVRTCDCAHCQTLVQYLIDDGIPFDRLGYEDVFTPLKHHEGLRLVVDETAYLIRSDLCYREQDTDRNFRTSVDPFSVWNGLDLKDRQGRVSFEVRG